MGLFGKSKEIPYDWKFYDGTDLNTNWEVPNLIDALEISFHFLCKKISKPEELVPELYNINNAAHVFLDQKICETVLNDFNSKQSQEYTYYQTDLSNFLEDVLNNKFDAIVIYGMPDKKGNITPGYKIIGKDVIEKNIDLINIHRLLRWTKSGYYDKATGYENIKDYPLFVNCNKDILNLQPDENGKINIPAGAKYKANPNSTSIPIFYDTIALKTKDGMEHNAVRAFVSEYSAMCFGGDKDDLIKMSLAQIKENGSPEVVIEPHRNWWVLF